MTGFRSIGTTASGAGARQQLKEEFPSIAAQDQTLRLDALNAVVQ